MLRQVDSDPECKSSMKEVVGDRGRGWFGGSGGWGGVQMPQSQNREVRKGRLLQVGMCRGSRVGGNVPRSRILLLVWEWHQCHTPEPGELILRAEVRVRPRGTQREDPISEPWGTGCPWGASVGSCGCRALVSFWGL